MKNNLTYQKVKAYTEQMEFLSKGDTVVAGVSGGADSVCLLCMLKEMREEKDFSLRVVHVNHGLRKTADRDEEFVRSLCKRWDIPFTAVQADVAGYGREKGISAEEAGRELRYRAMEEALGASQAKGKIAVAHNMDDNSETMLLHLFRGSGLKGLAGIPPRRGGIIRPLLCLTRKEIEAFLFQQDLPYCVDETNLEDAYTRNRIRHHLLPTVCQTVNEKAVEKMWDTANIMREAEDYVFGETKRALEHCFEEERGLLRQEETVKLHPYLRKRVILEAMARVAESAKDIGAVHIRETEKLFFSETGKKADLPYDIEAIKDYDGVRLQKKKRKKEALSEELLLEEPGEYELSNGDKVVIRILEGKKSDFFENFPNQQYTKWFDYDKIGNTLCLRKRKTGDYFILDDTGKRKKVKNYLIDEKIPERERDAIRLLADGEQVLWIVGYRMGAGAKVSDATKRVLEVRYEKGAKDAE